MNCLLENGFRNKRKVAQRIEHVNSFQHVLKRRMITITSDNGVVVGSNPTLPVN